MDRGTIINGDLTVAAASDPSDSGYGDVSIARNAYVDTIIENTASAGTTVEGITFSSNHITIPEISAPANPAASKHRLYVDSSDSRWKSRDSSGIVTTYAPTTTKGDLTVHNGTTQTRLAVGTDGYVLTADSSQSSGVAWAQYIALPTEFQYAESDATSSTTSSTFQTKTMLTTATLSGGTYRVEWSYEWNYDAISRDFAARISIDSTVVADHREEPKDSGSDQWCLASGIYIGTLSAASHTILLQYRETGSSDVASIRRARLVIWKVVA